MGLVDTLIESNISLDYLDPDKNSDFELTDDIIETIINGLYSPDLDTHKLNLDFINNISFTSENNKQYIDKVIDLIKYHNDECGWDYKINTSVIVDFDKLSLNYFISNIKFKSYNR